MMRYRNPETTTVRAFTVALVALSLLLAACRPPNSDSQPLVVEGLGPIERLNPSQVDYQTLPRIVEATLKAKAFNRAEANVLAEIYRANAQHFSSAAARAGGDPRVFDAEDVRAFLIKLLEHQETRETISQATRQEAARLVREHANFSRPASGQSSTAGHLIGVYTSAYTRAVLRDDRAAADEELHRQQGLSELLVLATYDDVARQTLDNTAGVEAAGRAQARAFRDAINAYDAALPAGEKILDANGKLLEPSKATGRQLENLQNLANGVVPPGLQTAERDRAQQAASLVAQTIAPAIRDLTIAKNEALRKI